MRPSPRRRPPRAQAFAGLAAVFQPRPAGVALAITGPALKGADLAGAYFYPFESTVIDHAKPQAIEGGKEGLTLTLHPRLLAIPGRPGRRPEDLRRRAHGGPQGL